MEIVFILQSTQVCVGINALLTEKIVDAPYKEQLTMVFNKRLSTKTTAESRMLPVELNKQ